MGRDRNDISIIVPVNIIVGDTDAERAADRELLRGMLSFYGSTPNYAFIWDEAGFEGTTERIRERQKHGDAAGMAAQITDDHLATFCTEATWGGLAQTLVDKYDGVASRLVFYNALMGHPERVERFGEIAKEIRFLTEP
jgi:alkanesulfonate monooxygenase SsuD/methylene tetrahydromethanopterin reductase-like flavin-dependent oxidoreductase (luciferase family)